MRRNYGNVSDKMDCACYEFQRKKGKLVYGEVVAGHEAMHIFMVLLVILSIPVWC